MKSTRRNRFFAWTTAAMVAVGLAGTPADAQERIDEFDDIFGWVTPSTPGGAVAVSLNGKVVVDRVYGMADLERNVPITADTVFDIGSLQKQFVAAAVLRLVDEGKLALDDDVRKRIPELPEYTHTITLDHLLTHTSGLRDWVGLSNFSSQNEDAMTLILRQRGLNFAPGEEWSYSNSGYVLLKVVVERASGMPFAEFARTRLFEPLGMNRSTYAEDIGSSENGAVAYEKTGDGWTPNVLTGDARGGGAVLSTARELLIWNDALTNARLGKFVSDKLEEPARLNNGRKLSYARGLILDENRGGRLVWHGGSAAGYKSLLCRYPEQGLSIAILSNAGESANTMAMARRIFDRFVPDAGGAEPSAPAEAVGGESVDGVDPTRWAGLFFREQTAEPMRLIAHGNGLRIAGGPALVPIAADRFRNAESDLRFMSEAEFELHFPSPDEFEIKTLEGETYRYRRAEPCEPTPDELKALAGRYECEELQAVFEVEPGRHGLRIRLNGLQSIDVEPVGCDAFQRGLAIGRFRRDELGKVVAIDYSNPMIRNVRFNRVDAEAGGG